MRYCCKTCESFLSHLNSYDNESLSCFLEGGPQLRVVLLKSSVNCNHLSFLVRFNYSYDNTFTLSHNYGTAFVGVSADHAWTFGLQVMDCRNAGNKMQIPLGIPDASGAALPPRNHSSYHYWMAGSHSATSSRIEKLSNPSSRILSRPTRSRWTVHGRC